MKKSEWFAASAWLNWLILTWAMLLGFPFEVTPWVAFWVFFALASLASLAAMDSKKQR